MISRVLFAAAAAMVALAQAETILTQADFDQGTLRIDTPGVYKLGEDIVFRPQGELDPASPETWMFPNPADFPTNAAYRLGFFAAITIEANDVTLDLNGHKLSQSPEHALVQRFFALIELGSSPFIPGAGPANFGSEFVPAVRTTIKNGVLGLSSHHGIHGNGCTNVTLEDLEIVDFEVAGISINNVDGLVVDTVDVKNTRKDVPANGRLSQAIFALQTASVHLDVDESIAQGVAVTNAMTSLRSELYDYLSSGGSVDNPLFNSFANGRPDASLVAGILVHGGVHVGDFQRERPEDSHSARNIEMRDVSVHNLDLKGKEIGALQHRGTDALVRDATAAIFDIDFATDGSNNYLANGLADLQLALADYKEACTVDPACSFSPSAQALINRHAIPMLLVQWSKGEASWSDVIHEYRIVGNHDIMFHKNKGIIGIKLDGVKDARLQNVDIRRINNLSTQAELSKLIEAGVGEPREYTGYETRGITVAGSERVQLIDVTQVQLNSAVLQLCSSVETFGETLDIASLSSK